MIPDSATNYAAALASAHAMTPTERAESRARHDLATACPAWRAAHRDIARQATTNAQEPQP